MSEATKRIGLVGIAAAGIVLFLYVFPTGPSSVPALQSQGQTLVDAVERYRSDHGEYPPTLEAAGVSPLRTQYGRWKYGRTADGGFALKVGDYGRDEFEMRWSYREKRWFVDS
jgi:hypothetical protein